MIIFDFRLKWEIRMSHDLKGVRKNFEQLYSDEVCNLVISH